MSEQGSVRIRLLGPFAVSAAERPVPISSEKVRSLLAYLALRPGESVTRDELIAALWPDSDEATARPRLRRVIWRLRRALLPAEHELGLKSTPTTVSLMCSPDAVDAVDFRKLVANSGSDLDKLRAAADLYKGDLLQGSTDEWIDQARFHYRALFLRAIKQLVSLLNLQRSGKTAIIYARRGVELDPTDEELVYAFMQAAMNAGEPTVALAQYDILARMLMEDMGVAPAGYVTAFFEQIRGAARAQVPKRTDKVPFASTVDEFVPETIALTARSTERQRLLQALDRARGGRSSAVLITGSAGVGKTRLADALITEARFQKVAVYHGRCSDVPNPPPYHPIVEALWGELSGRNSEISPALSALLSTLPSRAGRGRSRFRSAAATFDGALISESLLHILPDSDDPLALLVIDDIHRADHASWVWLNSVLSRLSDLRLCVVLTSRIGETDEQDARIAQLATSGMEVVALEPLDVDDVRSLISAALGVPRAPGLLWRTISRHIGGNPLQILEALRLLKGRELLRRSGDIWTIDPAAAQVLATLASSQVSALVQQRIALLPETARHVLSAAAILGMEINPDHLRTLTGLSQIRFFSHIERLTKHRLILSRIDTSLAFPHEEIRKTVLDQIIPVRRRWLHARAADLLSRVESTRPEDLYWHYHGAGDVKGALSAAAAAGDGSYAVGEHGSAVAWYDRALAALPSKHRGSDLRTRLDLELKLEAALNQHGNRPRQLLVLESAEEIATSAGLHNDLCEVLIRRSLCLTRTNEYDAAIRAAERAVDLARRRTDLHREAQAHRAMGLAHENSGGSEAIGLLNKALRSFRQLGATREESLTLSELATAYGRLGNNTAALQALDKAAALVPHDDRTRAFFGARRAAALLWTGRLSETYAALQEALTLLRRFGDRIGEARTLRVLADAHVQAGRYRDALAATVHGLQVARQGRDTRLVISFLNSFLGGVLRRLGIIPRAEATFRQIVQLAGTDLHPVHSAMYEDSLSTVYLHAGQWEKARSLGEHALATLVAAHNEGYVTSETRLHLAHALLELGEPAPAKELLLASLAYHRQAGELPLQAFAAGLFALAAVELGDADDAEMHLRDSVRIFHRIDVLQDAHLLLWLHGRVWSRLGSTRQAGRAFRAAYAEMNRVSASLGGPLRRRFMALPFQRRILDSVAPQLSRTANSGRSLQHRQYASTSVTDSFSGVQVPERESISGARRVGERRKAVLRALTESASRPTRQTLAAVLGVTPRTITNDIAALRRAGHKIVIPRNGH